MNPFKTIQENPLEDIKIIQENPLEDIKIIQENPLEDIKTKILPNPLEDIKEEFMQEIKILEDILQNESITLEQKTQIITQNPWLITRLFNSTKTLVANKVFQKVVLIG